jgi:hypothetical protein
MNIGRKSKNIRGRSNVKSWETPVLFIFRCFKCHKSSSMACLICNHRRSVRIGILVPFVVKIDPLLLYMSCWYLFRQQLTVNSCIYIYTAMPTARQNILSTFWNVQFVVFNTSEKLNNNLVNAWMATEAMMYRHSRRVSDMGIKLTSS